MEKQLVDPNKESRQAFMIGTALCLALCLVTVFVKKEESFQWILPGIFLVAAALFYCYGGIKRPYVVLSPEGVSVKMLFWTRFFQWKELRQAGIYRTNPEGTLHADHVNNRFEGTEYLFPMALIGPKGKRRNPGADTSFTGRFLHCFILPGTQQVREYVETYYGKLDFDDVAALNSYEKRKFGF